MKANQLTVWIMGALLTILLVLVGILASTTGNRLDRIEAKIDSIQSQYGTIPAIQAIVIQHTSQLDRIETWIYKLFRETK